MCVVIDLDAVCLVCLQPSKEMHDIFAADTENTELQIAQKISILSELKTDQNNQTLPSKICNKCLQDLRAAWRFRKNCQAAVTIFQTIVRLDDIQPTAKPDNEDEAAKELAEQKIKVPQGLQIKRINSINEERDEGKKSGEFVIEKKNTAVQEFVINNAETSPLFEELTPFVGNNDNVRQSFQILQGIIEEGNENEVEPVDDDTTLVELYLTEGDDPDETEISIQDKTTTISKVKTKIAQKSLKVDERQRKLTGYLDNSSKRQARGRPRKQNVQKIVTKITDPIISGDDSSQAVQPEVKQVKTSTRKRTSVSPETKLPKICGLCGNSYRFQHALNAHMRRHFNDKPFPCDFCDKAFVSNVELRRHMRVHTGQKPYACQYCERRFSDFGSRIKHERTHTGERPYHCITCGKSFAYPHVLSVHVRTHTGEKRFPCNYCSKGFTKKAYLISHVEQHHNSHNEFQVVIENTMDNSQNQTDSSKSETFEECIYTTEFADEEGMAKDGYDDDSQQGPDKIIIRQSVMQTEVDDENEAEMHEIEEGPDEYTINVR